MRIPARLWSALALMLLMPLAATAQEKQFTLEDLNFGGTNYRNMIPQNRTLQWWGDRLIHLTKDSCMEVSLKNGKEKLLFTLEKLNGWCAPLKLRSLERLTFPYAGSKTVLASDGKHKALVDFGKGTTVWSRDVNDEQASSWSKESRATAYVSGDNLWVEDAGGERRQLTTDGSRDIVYGQSVHRNEWGIDGGLFWSPDGQKLAFYRMDQSMVDDYPLVNVPELDDSAHVIAMPAPEKYPMAGCTSHKVTIGVYDLGSRTTTYLDAGDPTDRYFTNIAWSPDSKQIYVQELNRDQNDMRLVVYNAATGKKGHEIYREGDDKYVEPQTPIVFLPWDAGRFILQSQRDGYNHLYVYRTDGSLDRQLTSGQWVVKELLGFDTKTHSAIIVGNADSPMQRDLYRVGIDDGVCTRIDASGKGCHRGSLSTSGKWLVDTWQEPDVPRKIAIVDTETGKALDYFASPDPWAGYAVPEYRSGSIKADDGTTDLFYRMVMPVGFDPKKKYPTVVYVYGGPHAHNVDAGWHYNSRSWETYMAQRGYLLFILDNRGSENRGKEFEQATFRQLGQVEMRDQMRGVDFLRSLEYVDTARMGVHGWSFGGFMTISLMTNYPDVFKVGVAGGPVIDWKWYEVMYGERYMDTPETNPEGYRLTSLLGKAKDLKGRLQIIIGLNDPTVVPQHAYSFLKACIAAGTQPDFFVYPGQGHNMRGHQSVHLHERITRYFDDYLK